MPHGVHATPRLDVQYTHSRAAGKGFDRRSVDIPGDSQPSRAGDLAKIATAESVAFAPVVCDRAHETWMLMAGPAEVGRCIDRLRLAGALLDTTVTIIRSFLHPLLVF